MISTSMEPCLENIKLISGINPQQKMKTDEETILYFHE